MKYVSGPARGTLGDRPRKEGEADGEALSFQVQELKIEPLRCS